MTERPKVPAGVGPHEERELELMLKGTKPLAMFSDIIPSAFVFPDADFEPHVTAGRLVQKEFWTKTSDGQHDVRYLFYALPGEEWRIEEAFELCAKGQAADAAEVEADEARMGFLLGYSDAEVQAFLTWTTRPNGN